MPTTNPFTHRAALAFRALGFPALFLLATGLVPLYAQNINLLSVNPNNAAVGAAVSIAANGFVSGAPVGSVTVTLTPLSGPVLVATANVVGAGTVRTMNFAVPAGAAGDYSLAVSGAIASVNSLPFHINASPSFSLNPASGGTGLTLQVTITGASTTFPSGTTARFGPGISVGGAPENQFGPVAVQPNGTAIATISISLTAAVGPRTVDVVGLHSISTANAFTVTTGLRPLTLLSINPPSGNPGAAISIIANGFQSGVATPTMTVTLTPVPSGAPINVSGVVPGLTGVRPINFFLPGIIAPGPYQVTVSSPAYASVNSLPFTVNPPPSFILNPISGAAGTTLQVSITRVNTTFPPNATTARFGAGISVGGAPEGQFGPVVVQPDGNAIATIVINPAATLGVRTVDLNGSDAITQANGFTVTGAPQLISASPNSGMQGQSLNVTITGSNTNFNAGSTVSFGSGVIVNSVTFVSPTSLAAAITIAPNAIVGPRDIIVTTNGLPLIGLGLFNVTLSQPLITAINPNTAPQGQTLSVTITGSNTSFNAGSSVSLGAGVTVNSVAFNSASSLTANITIASNATIGLRDVVVTTNGTPVVGANLFTVTAAPGQITAVTPNSGQQGQSRSVVITGVGTNFSAASSVSFGPGVTVTSISVGGPTNLTVGLNIAPDAAIGLRDVTVTTAGTPVVGVGLFTVTVAPSAITTVVPGSGQQGQTLAVTITGVNTNFNAGSTVSFGSGVIINSVTLNNSSSLTANISIAPAATIGLRDVTVTTGGSPVIGAGLFQVTTAEPQQIISVNPSSGQQAETLSVTITGSGTSFSNTSAVTFGPGVTVNSVSFLNMTSLTANITIAPGAAPGLRDVTVTTNGTPVTGLGLFSVIAPVPRLVSVSPNLVTQGQTLTLNITGEFTAFLQGVTQVSLGPGITINTVTVTSATALTASITIASNATPGSRTLSVPTGTQVVSLADAVTVAVSTPELISVNPGSGRLGRTLDIALLGSRTNFVQGTSQVSLGAGITVNSVTVSGSTSLNANITIAAGALLGARTVTVTTGAEVVSLPNGFIVTSAAGQSGPLACSTSVGVPPMLRAEGFTELIGDVLIVCTGGDPGQTNTINLQLFLNTQITSRLVGGQSEALLIVDAPVFNAQPAASGKQTYRAVPPQQGDNSLVWTNVQITAPGANDQTVLRIVNVRANASGLGVSASLVPSQVIAFVSVSPSQSLPLSSPQQIVGYVQPGLTFDVRNCNNTASISVSFVQCAGENSGGSRDLIAGTAGTMQFAVRFTEGFQTSFKTQLAPGQMPSVAGVVYHSESGFLNTPTMSYAVGGADSGTRLAARFTNLPAGARLFVTTGQSQGSTLGLGALLVRTSANGGGGSAPQGGGPAGIAETVTLFCPLSGIETGFGSAEIPVINGTALAAWEVTETNAAALEQAVFGVSIAYAPDTANKLPGLGQASVAGSFAPFYAADSDAGRMSASLPIPRFVDNPVRSNAFRIDACVTNLLFPFVTNQVGFDTGIAVANTSRDPFGVATRPQSGACTINYFGATPSGPAPSPQISNSAVEAGSVMTFVVSSGGSHGISSTPGFQGYIIVQCDFRYAHGFAFVTDGPIGSARVAEGYLGLVMDSGIVTRGSLSESLSQ